MVRTGPSALSPPVFFEKIRSAAEKRWKQLEDDEELAGPWHQLFRQVQSPRHVVSELLQNADDAGATYASVRIDGGTFVFEHDGADFDEAQLASLCRFGYSNKRTLHTIGFRGIGFKSTFSLGNSVDVLTPTLRIRFDRKRFSEPIWTGSPHAGPTTAVRVRIADEHRARDLEKNLAEWRDSPLSLLFFKNVRRLRIGEKDVAWTLAQGGPVPNSSWMRRKDSDSNERLLVIRSPEEEFPAEAQAEIRQERMVSDESSTPPACRVEIVVGVPGRLFVVLPTGVKTHLPFAANAPFIQDPARLKIKDPETSPTNRWLLDRIGALAGGALLAWIVDEKAPVEKRANAYALLPDVNREDRSLEGVCGASVEIAFSKSIEGKPVLLGEDGTVGRGQERVALPPALAEVWPPERTATQFDAKGRKPLSRFIAPGDRQKLLSWTLLEEIDKARVLAVLSSQRVTRPAEWKGLEKLWLYLAADLTGYSYSLRREQMRVLPVQGSEVLHSASETVRLGEKKFLKSEDDWKFLGTHLNVLDPRWPRFIADTKRDSEGRPESPAAKTANASIQILERLDLHEPADASSVIEKFALAFFAKPVSVAECVRLAHIAAELEASVGESFHFVTRANGVSAPGDVLVDADGSLEALLPEGLQESRLLHPHYVGPSQSCSREKWNAWIASGRSGVPTFPPFVPKTKEVWGDSKIEAEVQECGYDEPLTSHYKVERFRLDDWDFEPELLKHWESSGDSSVWGQIVERILGQSEGFWAEAASARVLQFSSKNGTTTRTIASGLVPRWVRRLRDLPCLRDVHGKLCQPAELLLRTPETEPLRDVEAFVHPALDREATRPLLDLLGVRSNPTGPAQLLERIRALSRAPTPPIAEVEKWYRRLDQLAPHCSTDDLDLVRKAFGEEKLILTDSGSWTTARTVYLAPDEEDVPGADIIRSGVRDLTLWHRVGVNERPTADMSIRWLRTLRSGEKLSADDMRRARAFVVRHPVRVWHDCSHWPNLAGEWCPVSELAYALSLQSLIPWTHLHEWVKQKTADFQRLPVDVLAAEPFSAIPTLSSCVEDALQDADADAEREARPWLTTFGEVLRRIVREDLSEQARLRELATELAQTHWVIAPDLAILPYIDGKPAGTPRESGVAWQEQTLYTRKLTKARLARIVPAEIGRAFELPEIKAALDYCFDRSPDDVREYLTENFELAEEDTVLPDMPAAVEGVPAAAAPDELDPPPASASEPESVTPVETSNGAEPESDHSIDEPPSEETEEAPKKREPKAPPKPSLIERFARVSGFAPDGDGRFCRKSDGAAIVKTTDGEVFPWAQQSRDGNVGRYFWPEAQCLDRKPIELDAGAWNLIERHPDQYSLLLESAAGEPLELSGSTLLALQQRNELRLLPAAYRLVKNGGSGA